MWLNPKDACFLLLIKRYKKWLLKTAVTSSLSMSSAAFHTLFRTCSLKSSCQRAVFAVWKQWMMWWISFFRSALFCLPVNLSTYQSISCLRYLYIISSHRHGWFHGLFALVRAQLIKIGVTLPWLFSNKVPIYKTPMNTIPETLSWGSGC